MKQPVFALAVSLISGCTTLLPTADQVPDESGYGAAIYGDKATVSITYAGKASTRHVFLVSVVNQTDDTLFLEPGIIRYFASSMPFVPVQRAPDEWMALSARNSKLPMTMHFAMEPGSATEDPRESQAKAVWKTVPPYETLEEQVHLQPDELYKYYRLVMVVSGDFYVFDFARWLLTDSVYLLDY